jgi:hypothetical protein
MSQRHIALSGPLNGRYIDAQQAFAHSYELIDWQPGEQAYLHTTASTETPAELEDA